MVWEKVVECLPKARLQFSCWLFCGVSFESVFYVFCEVVYQCVVSGGHPIVDILKLLLGCCGCCLGGDKCVVVKEFERIPPFMYGFFVGDRALRPGDPEGGWWIIGVCVEVELFKGVDVVVNVGEGVGW